MIHSQDTEVMHIAKLNCLLSVHWYLCMFLELQPLVGDEGRGGQDYAVQSRG